MTARQRLRLKNQALFSSKDKSKKLKCPPMQFLFGALRVNVVRFLEQPEGFCSVSVNEKCVMSKHINFM